MPRYLVCVFSGVCGGAEGEPVAAGGAGVWPVVGEADGVAVVEDAWPPIRWALVSLSRRPVTLMFSAFWELRSAADVRGPWMPSIGPGSCPFSLGAVLA